MKRIIGILIGLVALAASVASAAEALPVFELGKKWVTRIDVKELWKGNNRVIYMTRKVTSQEEIDGRKVWRLETYPSDVNGSPIEYNLSYSPHVFARTLYGYDENGITYLTPINYDEKNVTYRPVMDFNLRVGDLTLPEGQNISQELNNAKIETRVESIEEIECCGEKRKAIELKTTVIAPGQTYDGEVTYDWWIEGLMLSDNDLLTPVADRYANNVPDDGTMQYPHFNSCYDKNGSPLLTLTEWRKLVNPNANGVFELGKKWVTRIDVKDLFYSKTTAYYATVKVAKDTIIDEQPAWRLEAYLSDKAGSPAAVDPRYVRNFGVPRCYCYEKDGVVYIGCTHSDKFDVKFKPCMDFNFKTGESVLPNGILERPASEFYPYFSIKTKVDEIKSMTFQGVDRRVMKLTSEMVSGDTESSATDWWVEGMLPSNHELMWDLEDRTRGAFEQIPTNGILKSDRFEACYDRNDICLLSAAEWDALVGREAAKEITTYPQVFAPGKTWIYSGYADGGKPLRVSVAGDTTLLNYPMTKLCIETLNADMQPEAGSRIYRAVLEVDGVIYAATESETNGEKSAAIGEVMRFGQAVGTPASRYSDERVVSDQMVDISGVSRRVSGVSSDRSDQTAANYWIEGIGSVYAYELNLNGESLTSRRLLACYDGDKQIFGEDDLKALGVTGAITELENAAAEESAAIYDLQGRRVQTPGRGLYIINGRKTLVR